MDVRAEDRWGRVAVSWPARSMATLGFGELTRRLTMVRARGTSPRWTGYRSTSMDTNVSKFRTWATVVWYKCFTSSGWQLVEGDRRLGIQSVRSLWTGVSSTTIYLCRCPRLENRLHPRPVREPQLQPTQDLGGNSGVHLLQGSFGGMRTVQATLEVSGWRYGSIAE